MATGSEATGPAVDPRDLGASGAQRPASASVEHSERSGEPEQAGERSGAQSGQPPGEMSETDLDLQILINCQLAAKHASAAAAAALQRYLIRREGSSEGNQPGKKRRKFFMDRAAQMVQPDQPPAEGDPHR